MQSVMTHNKDTDHGQHKSHRDAVQQQSQDGLKEHESAAMDLEKLHAVRRQSV
jgi:hypothetical protein